MEIMAHAMIAANKTTVAPTTATTLTRSSLATFISVAEFLAIQGLPRVGSIIWGKAPRTA